MQSVEWGEYKIDDLFEKIKTNSIKNYSVGILPATTAIVTNNQIGKYICSKTATILENVFSATANGFGRVFYQPKPFTVLQDSYAFKFKDASVEIEKIYPFFLTSLNIIYNKYDWGNKSGWEKVRNEYIQLPTKNNKIDYEFMENFVAELEAQRVAELEAYLTATNLKDIKLTYEEEQALENYNNIVWDDFSYDEFFTIVSIKTKLSKSDFSKYGKTPVFSAESTNNGIMGYTDICPTYFVNEKNPIYVLFGDHTRRFNFANLDFCVADNVKLLSVKNNLNIKNLLFITTSWQKMIPNKGYARHWSVAEKCLFKLPTNNGKIDCGMMELIMSALYKQVIKDVVEYADLKTKTTKDVINKKG